MKLYYIANARMPNEKAHGIQIAKTCEAFASLGVDVELVLPTRGGEESLQSFYGLKVPVKARWIKVPDWYRKGRFGFAVSSVLFSLRAVLFLWSNILRGESFSVYTIDMDGFSFAFLALVPRPLFCEMHTPKRATLLTRWFFSRAEGVIATNPLIGRALSETFHIQKGRMHVEPNGVDDDAIQTKLTKEEARAKLGLAKEERIALYVGRFYAWKGLDTLAKAAAIAGEIAWQVVGGTKEAFASVVGNVPISSSVVFAGERPSKEIPLWLAAADVLLILGTAGNIDSYRYTAPMKVFEYASALRPIVASHTPALASIIEVDLVWWYKPDDAEDLARKVNEAFLHGSDPRIERMAHAARAHSWEERTKRIISSIEQHD